MVDLDREVGTCVITRLEDGRVEVVRADPLIEVDLGLVEQFKRGLIERADYEDDVLTIHAVDGDVVYRLVTDQFGRLYPNTQLMERVERAHL